MKSKWTFKYVHFDLYGDVRDSTVQVNKLTDGRVKYSGAWYTFYVSKDRREIKLVLAANKTKVQCSVTFFGQHKASFSMDFDFGAYQKPDTAATN